MHWFATNIYGNKISIHSIWPISIRWHGRSNHIFLLQQMSICIYSNYEWKENRNQIVIVNSNESGRHAGFGQTTGNFFDCGLMRIEHELWILTWIIPFEHCFLWRVSLVEPTQWASSFFICNEEFADVIPTAWFRCLLAENSESFDKQTEPSLCMHAALSFWLCWNITQFMLNYIYFICYFINAPHGIEHMQVILFAMWD